MKKSILKSLLCELSRAAGSPIMIKETNHWTSLHFNIKPWRFYSCIPTFQLSCKHLASIRLSHRTRFICQTHYGRTIENVDLITLKNEAGHEALMSEQLEPFDKIQKLSKQYRQGLESMKKAGYLPDIVISHSGFGCGLYVKELWPNVQLISYMEWWFNPESPFFNYDPDNNNLAVSRSSIRKSWKRNQSLAMELSVSDAIVSQRNGKKISFQNF